MRKVSVFRHKHDLIIRIPKDFDLAGISEFTVEKCGDTIVLRPVRPSWISMIDEPRPDDDFLCDRADIIENGRLSPDGDKTGPL